MTSATMRHARGASRGEGYGMVVFAAVLLGMLGLFNIIDGIAAIARSSIFIGNAKYVFGDLRTWGWVALILGVLQVLVSIGVMAGKGTFRLQDGKVLMAGDRGQGTFSLLEGEGMRVLRGSGMLNSGTALRGDLRPAR